MKNVKKFDSERRIEPAWSPDFASAAAQGQRTPVDSGAFSEAAFSNFRS